MRDASIDDVLDGLVGDCLARMEEDGPAALQAFCEEHPEHADVLRRRVALLAEMGLGGEQPVEVPERLGPFRLTGLLGGGGMGVVYRAVQEDLGREVALKLIRPEHLYFPGARERFRREVETIARLQHPGIVPVYTVGEESGVPYFAMERVRGASLDDVLRELAGRRPETLSGADFATAVDGVARRHEGAAQDVNGPERAETAETAETTETTETLGYLYGGSWEQACLRIVGQIAEALEHAHQRGILHRDIKPSNIMVTADPADSTAPSRALLLDFGLTTSSDTGRLTRTGSRLGSLPYMSPEQTRGEVGALGPQTDVYSLGVTLYELLTLRAAFEGESDPALTNAIQQGDRIAPRQHDPGISWEAETVCLTAMDPDPARRYACAADFARDIANVLDHRPIDARRAGPWLRARRWMQRHPAATVGLVLGTLLVVGGPTAIAIVTAQANVQIEAEATEAKRQRERADERAAEASANLALAEASRAEADEARRLAEERADAILRLSAMQDLERLRAEADSLWPIRPGDIPAYEAWLSRAETLLAGVPAHEATLAEVRARAQPWEGERRELAAWSHPGWDELVAARADQDRVDAALGEFRDRFGDRLPDDAQQRALVEQIGTMGEELHVRIAALEEEVFARTTYTFDTAEDAWWNEMLEGLLADLAAFADPDTGLIDGVSPEHHLGVRRRLDFARTIEERSLTAPDVARLWDAAIAEVAGSPAYAGVSLTPQLGLVPLGPDPDSGLAEFGHLLTGVPAERDPETGRLILEERTGLVFVLIPGGPTTIGIQAEDPAGPNYDPDARPLEVPTLDIRLAPYFISKYELTQAQWERVCGHNPSDYQVGGVFADVTPLHPVEKVSWHESTLTLTRLGLALPSMAQWECAARGGTSTPFWTGTDRESLIGAVNLLDEDAIMVNPSWRGGFDWPGFSDGYDVHAPVDALRPNPFGLHHVHGNLREWCRDTYGTRVLSVTEEFERIHAEPVGYTCRGGGFTSSSVEVRIGRIIIYTPETSNHLLGVRPIRRLDP